MQWQKTKSHSGTSRSLLDAAEGLFLQKGYEGVAVREITDAAGANVAAINYHFGSKRNLYREVFRRILSDVAWRKLKALESVLPINGKPDLSVIIRVYVSEFLGEIMASRKADKIIKLLTAEMSENGLATDVLVNEMSLPVHEFLKKSILQAIPYMAEDKAALCAISITAQMFHFVRAREIIRRITGRRYDEEFLSEIVEHITDFSVKAIQTQK